MRAIEVKEEIVWDWMRPEMATISRESTLEEAVARMKKLNIHHLIVLEANRFSGVLDARDLVGVWDKNKKVGELTRSDCKAIDERTQIREVVDLLVKRRLTAVPLMREGVVRGILTTTDLIRLLEAQLSEHRHPVADAIERGKDFLTSPIVQSLSRLLGGAGI